MSGKINMDNPIKLNCHRCKDELTEKEVEETVKSLFAIACNHV